MAIPKPSGTATLSNLSNHMNECVQSLEQTYIHFKSELCTSTVNGIFNLFFYKTNSFNNNGATVGGKKYSSPSILRYVFHIKPHIAKQYCEVISNRIFIIFAPEEAEMFKDYLFILA